jgi:hypothetical protein
LENFSKNETPVVAKVLEESAGAIRSVIRDGIEKAMAQFN